MGEIDFIAAARFDESYPKLLADFNWQAFYSEYAEFFSILAGELAKDYDAVLIDARTGVTDIGSICTMLMPDKLVLVFSPNRQSLEGALEAGYQAVTGRRQMAKEVEERGELQIFPLLSRVEDNEEKLKRQWVKISRESFERLMGELWGRKTELEAYFEHIRIHHRSFYAYGERIAVEEQAVNEAVSLAGVYHTVLKALDRRSLVEANLTVHWEAMNPKSTVFDKWAKRSDLPEHIRKEPKKLAVVSKILDLQSKMHFNVITGRLDELPPLYKALHLQLDEISDPEAITHAIGGLMFEAKQRWLQGDVQGARAQLQVLLERAKKALDQAPTSYYTPFIAAYIAFLLDLEDDTERWLNRAISLSSAQKIEWARLMFTSPFPLPQDQAFEKLLKELSPTP